jgi:predicted DCC family thiol-disulfide oxidoreductase YuxK
MPIVTRIEPDTFPVLLFDGDCGFCTASVQWLERWVRPTARIIAWQFADLAALGVDVQDCTTSIQWVTAPGQATSEAVAAAAVLRTGRPPWPVVGRAMVAPGVRQLANAVYRLIAANRYRLPGATPACRAETTETPADAAA